MLCSAAEKKKKKKKSPKQVLDVVVNNIDQPEQESWPSAVVRAVPDMRKLRGKFPCGSGKLGFPSPYS